MKTKYKINMKKEGSVSVCDQKCHQKKACLRRNMTLNDLKCINEDEERDNLNGPSTSMSTNNESTSVWGTTMSQPGEGTEGNNWKAGTCVCTSERGLKRHQESEDTFPIRWS